MCKIVIPTTQGPSEILRVIEEDPDIRSVICLKGTTRELPISGDYHAFVKRPTGVIEKTFGHGAFRVDVSRDISDGESWQLAMFIAHAHLARPAVVPTGLVWASGRVDHDLTVHPVLHISEKITKSKELFELALEDHQDVFIYVSKDNFEEAEKAVQLLGLENKITLRSIETLRDFLSENQVEGKEKTDFSRSIAQPKEDIHKGTRRFFYLFVLLTLFGFLGAGVKTVFEDRDAMIGLWQSGDLESLKASLKSTCLTCGVSAGLVESYIQEKSIQPKDIAVEVRKFGPAEGQTCLGREGLLVGSDDLRTTQLTEYERKSLCHVEYVLKNIAQKTLWVHFILNEKEGRVAELLSGEELSHKKRVGFLGSKTDVAWKIVASPFPMEDESLGKIERWGGLLQTGTHRLRVKASSTRFQ